MGHKILEKRFFKKSRWDNLLLSRRAPLTIKNKPIPGIVMYETPDMIIPKAEFGMGECISTMRNIAQTRTKSRV